ncbi:hypothetical protein PAEPH01_1187 [Pancytospora epiphaga]|nr:hypothetical protein PAEPH01_1187 [Pancytospora epiphaga]
MGNIQSMLAKRMNKVFSIFASEKPSSMAILGLDAAGKSTLVNLFRDVDLPTVPTLGFNIESVNICNTQIKIWDVGGQKEFINYWCEYVRDIQGLVFMVDIADAERFEAAFEGFSTLISHLQNNLPVLLLLNKKDLLGGDKSVENARISKVKSVFNIREDDAGMYSQIRVDQKAFRSQVLSVSVKNDLEKMKSPQNNWSIQDSSVFSGFKWLIDEMKNSNFLVN